MSKHLKLFSKFVSAALASCIISSSVCSAAVVGDVSGNGTIDIYDAIIIAKYGMGMVEFTSTELKKADYNGDGVVNLYDVIGIAAYLLEKGDFKEGWVTENGKTYYYSSGVKVTGFITIDGSMYYFGTNGAMRTGWQTVNSRKYYFGSGGAAVTGWQTIGSDTYYFGTDGVMRTGTQTINGKTYYFDDNGVYVPETDSGALKYAEEILALVNKERSAAGVSPLTLNATMTAAATKRAEEVSTYFSHDRPDGSSCFTVFDEYGLSWSSVGENIAGGYYSAESVMNGWMNSEGHRNNILSSDFIELGVGYCDGYWVQLFRAP